jgi:universal stress protein F
MIHTILAAVDGSPRAPHVVASAAELAERCGARVHLFRAVVVPPDFPPHARHPGAEVPRMLLDQAGEALRALAAAFPRIQIDPPAIVAGQPWRAILDAAERVDADLIVVGSHGYRGWDRILGTTAGKVADHAGRNVLVVHPLGSPA